MGINVVGVYWRGVVWPKRGVVREMTRKRSRQENRSQINTWLLTGQFDSVRVLCFFAMDLSSCCMFSAH